MDYTFMTGQLLSIIIPMLIFGLVYACFQCHHYSENHLVLPISEDRGVKITKDNCVKITEDQAKENCSICLGSFEDRKLKVVVLDKCKHMFHGECIVKWSCENRSCPVCRSVIKSVVMSEIIVE